MSLDVLGNGLPISESDYMALGETSARAELWDGNLLVRPRDTPRHQIIEAAEVRLVAEIVSPLSASFDQTLKMHGYADAGLAWYLLVEQESRSRRGHLLVGGRSVEQPLTQLARLLRGVS